MNWLTSASALVDLSRNRDAAAALLQLADTLESVGPILGRTDMTRLLLDAARDCDVAQAAEQALSAELRSAWGILHNALSDERVEALRPFFCRLADLGGPGCSAPRDGLSWPLLAFGESASAVSGRLDPDRLSLALAGGAGSRLELRPERVGGRIETLGMRLSGETEAAVGFSMPVRLGRVGVQAAAEAGLVLDYRWAAEDDDSAMRVLARALDPLPTPFDLAALASALGSGQLRALTFDGAASDAIGASVSLGDSLSVLGGTAVQLGLDFSASRERQSRVRMEIAPDASPSEPAVALRLSRRTSRAEIERIGLGLEVDPSAAVERFASGFAERAGDAAAAFRHMETLFPPASSGAVSFMDLDEAVREVDRATLERAFAGVIDSDELIERFRRKVMQVIDAEQGVWDQNTAVLARAIARRAATELGLGSADAQGVADAMQTRLTGALASLQNKLEPLLRTVPAIAKPRRGLLSIFRRDSQDPQADALAMLRRAQGLLDAFSSAVVRAARSKIKARLSQTTRRERERELDWGLRLYPARAGATALYQRLVTGDLDAVLADINGLGDATSAPAEIVAGRDLVTAGIRRERSGELVLLDVSLFERSIFDADVAIEVDQAGNIRVVTRGESLRERGGPGELRVLRAVNVFELAQAQDARQMTFSLSVTHREDDLEDREIEEFFTDLEKLGLLPNGTATRAKQLVRDQFGPRDQDRPAEMRLWLDLDVESLLRLLQISDPDGGLDGNRFDDRHVYRTAVAALSRGFAATGDGAVQNNVNQLIRRSKLGDGVEDVLLKLSDDGFRSANAPHASDSVFGGDQNEFDILTGMADRAEGLVDIIRAMREVWFSPLGDSSTRWREDDYLERQTLIDDRTQAWISGSLREAGLGAMFSEELRPFSLAFFETLARLSSNGESDVFLTASLWLPDGDDGRELVLVDG